MTRTTTRIPMVFVSTDDAGNTRAKVVYVPQHIPLAEQARFGSWTDALIIGAVMALIFWGMVS